MPSPSIDARDGDRPASLGPIDLPAEQIQAIKAHIARLSDTALRMSDRLPLGADATDVFRALMPKE